MLLETNPTDFDKLGSEAAGLFFEQSIPLEEAVIKLATENELNPEEVKRLVEKSNTYASVKMIKAASDKTVEFDLAAYASVLSKTHPEGTEGMGCSASTSDSTEKTASEIPDKMPSTLKDMALSSAQDHAFFQGPALQAEKTASEPAPATAKPLTKVFKAQQDINRLGQEKTAAELSFKKAADQLISNFSNLYGPDFTKFASEAYTLYGEPGKCILDVLAKSVKEPAEFSKVAYVVDDVENKELNLFKKAYDSLLKIDETRTSLEATRESLDAAWVDVKAQA